MKKKTILLACAQGLSTSMLVQKMLESAKNKGYNVHIEANPTNRTESLIDQADALLLGPQVRYELAKWEKIIGNRIPVRVINTQDYGLMNGEKVLEDIWKEIK